MGPEKRTTNESRLVPNLHQLNNETLAIPLDVGTVAVSSSHSRCYKSLNFLDYEPNPGIFSLEKP